MVPAPHHCPRQASIMPLILVFTDVDTPTAIVKGTFASTILFTSDPHKAPGSIPLGQPLESGFKTLVSLMRA